MGKSPIRTYLQQLAASLKEHGKLKRAYVEEVVSDVEARLNSLLSFWFNPSYRDTFLLLGQEEAEFYRPPQAPLLVRQLVVMAIRDSLMVDHINAHSIVNSDKVITYFTAQAILFWGEHDLDQLARQVIETQGQEQGIFAGLNRQYPAAWTALSYLAQLTPQKIHQIYSPVQAQPPVDLIGDDVAEVYNLWETYWPEMELSPLPQLNLILAKIQQQEAHGLIVDSFKSVTRNPHGLLRLLEFLLAHRATFASVNYFISANYVSRRRQLLRPAHTDEELQARMTSLLKHKASAQGISRPHYQALKLWPK